MAFFKDYGILGINARNLLYIRPFNKKKAIRLADDKLKSKHFLSARGVPVPKLFATIRSSNELAKFNFSSLPDSFVLKPNLGFGGEGIIPIVDRDGADFIKPNGDRISQSKMEEHIEDILEGRFSISGLKDTAFFEQRIVCDERVGKFAYKGLPDIRIVVHNLIPVMAMLRLPTRESDGKANLHQGAVGVGIDIARGTVTHLVHHNRIITEIPGVGLIAGLKIPYWDEILLIASRIQLITNLGYLAADIALDENSGPMLLEINARAGLNVQIANLAPLRKRLERIQGVQVTTPEKGVRIAQDMFGNKLEKEVKKVSGKAVIGSEEQVKILLPNESRYVWASINPLLEQTVLSKEWAEKFQLKPEEESEQVKLKFVLSSVRLQTLARLDEISEKGISMIIGKKDLSSFLIDPSRGRSKLTKLPHFSVDGEENVGLPLKFLEVDGELTDLDKNFKLLRHLQPINAREERERFYKDPSYSPQFEYRELSFDPFEMRKKLDSLKRGLDESAVARLLSGKILELERKVGLLESIGTGHFAERSEDLFLAPTPSLLHAAQEKLNLKPKSFPEPRHMLSLEEGIVEFERVFRSYGLGNWRVKVNKNMTAYCSAGKQNTLFVRADATFSPDRLRMLIAHEIETHILTAENGKYQALSLFNRGFGDYLQTQEGLAIWNQEQVLSYDVEKNYRSAILVFAVDFARKHGFAETYDYCLKLGMNENRAYQTTLKLKRGMEDTSQKGAFTKELLYFAGYLQIKDYVEKGLSLKDLYYGKFNLKDLQLIKQVPRLQEPQVYPHFLREL